MRDKYLTRGMLDCPIGGGYPAQAQISGGAPPRFRLGLVLAVKRWKSAHYGHWAQKTTQDRLEALKRLSRAISRLYGVSPPEVTLATGVTVYLPLDKRIVLSRPSIISLLHELGHHLFGPSEYHACRFSYWLFKSCFPSETKRLIWQGTTMVSPS